MSSCKNAVIDLLCLINLAKLEEMIADNLFSLSHLSFKAGFYGYTRQIPPD